MLIFWSDTWDSVQIPTRRKMTRGTSLTSVLICVEPAYHLWVASVILHLKLNIIFDCMQPCFTTQDQGKDVNWAETFIKVMIVHLWVRLATCIQAIKKLRIQLAEVSCQKIISPTSVTFWYIINSGVQTYPFVWLMPEFSCAFRFLV